MPNQEGGVEGEDEDQGERRRMRRRRDLERKEEEEDPRKSVQEGYQEDGLNSDVELAASLMRINYG